MRAAVLSRPHAIEVVSMDDPRPRPGEVLVRVRANAICGSDLTAYRGKNPRGSLPTVLGHELAGVVTELGEGVDEGLREANVCVEPNRCCNVCELCTAGLPNICPDYHVLGESMRFQGGCAEYVTAPVSQTFVLPSGISTLEGALVQPLAISYSGAIQRGQVADGERVLVVGAGPIGLGVMLLASLRGARVMILDVVGYRLDKAREMGVDAAVHAEDPNLDQAALDFTEGAGFDLAVEAVGGTQVQSLQVAQRLTGRRGRIVVMGSFADGLIPFPANGVKNREQTVMGSIGHPGSFGPVIELLASGNLKPAGMVSHVVDLEGLAGALEDLDRKRNGVVKVVVQP